MLKLFDTNIDEYFNYIIDVIKKNLKQTILYDNITSVDIINKNISTLKSAYSGTVKFSLPVFYNIKDTAKLFSGKTDLEKITLFDKPDNNYEFVKIHKDEETTKNTYAGLIGLPNIENHNIYYYKQNIIYSDLLDIKLNNINELEIKEKENLEGKQEEPLETPQETLNSFQGKKQNNSFNSIINPIFKLCGLKDFNTKNYKEVDNTKLKYTALIDAGALLKDYTINDAVKILYKTINKDFDDDQKYYIVYVNKQQDKVKYSIKNEKDEFEHFEFNSNERYFYYYDNSHIVGVDLLQNNNIHGLITMTYTNSYTDIAQASFRLRQLGKTHTIDYILEDDLQNNNNDKEYYNKFISNLKNIKFTDYLREELEKEPEKLGEKPGKETRLDSDFYPV